MNHFFPGQKSSQPFCALNFLQKSIKIVLCALLLAISATGFSANPADFQTDAKEIAAAGNWSIQFDVPTPNNPGITILTRETYQSHPAFAGFNAQTVYNPDTGSIAMYFSGPASTLPPATEIATITLVDPVSGSQECFLVKTDGGGIMLILDEF